MCVLPQKGNTNNKKKRANPMYLWLQNSKQILKSQKFVTKNLKCFYE